MPIWLRVKRIPSISTDTATPQPYRKYYMGGFFTRTTNKNLFIQHSFSPLKDGGRCARFSSLSHAVLQ